MTKTRKIHKRTIIILTLICFSSLILLSNLTPQDSNESIDLNDLDTIDNGVEVLEDKDNIELLNEEKPKSSDSQEIEIITPENKSYSEPMEGYYPATYGFECDKIGSTMPKSEPEKEFDFVLGGTNSYGIEAEIDGHKKVMKYYSSGGRIDASSKFGQIQQFGTIECYFRTTMVGGNARPIFNLCNSAGTGVLDVRIGSTGIWGYYRGSLIPIDKASGGGMDLPVANQWHHIKIAYETRVGGRA